MRQELEEKLYEKYPELYGNHTLTMYQTNMCWGFTCDDGWYDIIDRLSSKLSSYVQEHGVNLLRADQVKEKFGTLRFYVNGYDDTICKMIDEADAESAVTCEVTGKPGVLCSSGYCLKTLCLEEAEKLGFKPCKLESVEDPWRRLRMTTRITFRIDPAEGKRVVLKKSYSQHSQHEYEIEPGVDYVEHIWEGQSIEFIEYGIEDYATE